MASETENRAAFEIQRAYCATMDAPITTRVVGAVAAALDTDSAITRRIRDWPGEPTADALPLRIVGGLHALAQSGESAEVTRLFAGDVTDADEAAGIVARAFAEHDAALQPWLDGPPQTNEAGRSGALMIGLIHVARRFGQPLEILEIGSSAGFNLLVDRIRYDLGGTLIGPADSPLVIRPDLRGTPPAPIDLRFHSVRGCEVAPIDVTDPAQAGRLRGYVWADNPDRMARLDTVIAMIRAAAVALDHADAADWVEARLAEPQPAGVTRVLMHSVVWQYLGPERQARIRAAMDAAGAAVDPERPLAWVRMEPIRSLHPRMEVWVESWPDGVKIKVAHSQAHGAWVEPVTADD